MLKFFPFLFLKIFFLKRVLCTILFSGTQVQHQIKHIKIKYLFLFFLKTNNHRLQIPINFWFLSFFYDIWIYARCAEGEIKVLFVTLRDEDFGLKNEHTHAET